MRLRLSFFVFCFAAIFFVMACDSSSNPIEDEVLSLTRISPTQGKRGTSLLLEGSGFVNTATVCFADTCGSATFISNEQLSAFAPAGSGVVDVSVRQNGEETVLKNAFTYQNEHEGNGVKFQSMSPTGGKAGDKIIIKGSGFSGTVKVCFGANCVDANLNSETELSAIVPDGSGSVVVIVIVGETRLNAGSFSYITESLNTVDWCILRTTQMQALPNTESGLIFAELYEEGCTPDAPARCNNLKVQLGYSAEATPQSFEWVNAERNSAFTGESAGNNDEFMATLKLAEGKYRFIYRASIDGETWAYCDSKGISAVPVNDNMGTLVVAAEAEPEVGWCRIMSDTAITSKPNEDSPAVYAQVFVKDCTKFDKPCNGLQAELGYGSPALSDPAAIGATYHWKKAAFNDQYDGSGGDRHGEYFTTLKSADEGNFSIVMRFSLNGSDWTYCDTADDNTFTASNAVKWTVKNEEPLEKKVEWCRVQWPKEARTKIGEASEYFYGRAYVAECTGPSHECPELKGQLGYGLKTDNVENFTWIDATHNANHVDSNNDEFAAQITPTAKGEYAVAYRFSLDGTNWEYCDFDDAHGFIMENTSTLLAIEAAQKEITWCKLIVPTEINVEVGKNSDLAFGQVHVAECTGNNYPCDGLTAYLGYGDKDADDATSFTWKEATFNKYFANENNSEYMARFNIETAGDYAFAFAFSLDGGTTKIICDSDGETLTYSKEAAGSLSVYEQKIDWCNLQWPESIEMKVNEESPYVFGRAYVQGCTEREKQCAKLTGYVGYALNTVTEPANFTFVEAEANSDHHSDNNDEFAGKITPTEAGDYHIIYAFSLDGGTTKSYCGLGDHTSFDIANAMPLKVTASDPPKPPVEASCGIPDWGIDNTVKVNETKDIFAQIFIADCTESSQCNKIVDSHMHYIDANLAARKPLSEWNTLQAQFNVHKDNNNEYKAAFSQNATQRLSFVYSFDLKSNPSDANEQATRKYCFANWGDYGYGSITVTE
ncbi:MAG: IPT/TIG domain-containing protein [Bradymonadia bacterium]|jgi:hypothetical protein